MKLSKQFPLNAMRVFEAVARQGSFTRAAEELGMTQTAVSYQIKLLEENLGEPLFLRQPRQIVKTDVAEQMLPNVIQAFDLLNEAVSTARQASDEILEIHSAPTFGSHWLARHLGDFQLQHPSIAVRLKRTTYITDFDRDTADIAIRWGDGPWPGLECHLLGQFAYTPMMSPSLAERFGDVSKVEDILKLPLIGKRNDPCWKRWFAAAGISQDELPDDWRFDYVEQDLCANTAMAGQGIAILDRIYFTDELASGRLVEPFDLYCVDEIGLWLVYPPSRRNAPKIKAFRKWVGEAVAKDIARTTPESVVVLSGGRAWPEIHGSASIR